MEKIRNRQLSGDYIPFKQANTEMVVRTAQPHYQVLYTPSALPYLLHWLRSGKNLDFCLLALCSCILSLLCHQTLSSLPSSSALTSSSMATNTAIANLSNVDVVIKAGLFTTSVTSEDEKLADES